MTARDEAMQREVDRAITWWARYLEGRLLPGIDAHIVARHGVEAMLEHGWRVIPKPPDWRTLRDTPPVDSKQNEAVRAVREKFKTRGETR